MENSLLNPVRTVRVLRPAFRVDECTSVVPTMDERDSERIPGYLLRGISGRHPHLLTKSERPPKARPDNLKVS